MIIATLLAATTVTAQGECDIKYIMYKDGGCQSPYGPGEISAYKTGVCKKFGKEDETYLEDTSKYPGSIMTFCDKGAYRA